MRTTIQNYSSKGPIRFESLVYIPEHVKVKYEISLLDKRLFEYILGLIRHHKINFVFHSIREFREKLGISKNQYTRREIYSARKKLESLGFLQHINCSYKNKGHYKVFFKALNKIGVYIPDKRVLKVINPITRYTKRAQVIHRADNSYKANTLYINFYKYKYRNYLTKEECSNIDFYKNKSECDKRLKLIFEGLNMFNNSSDERNCGEYWEEYSRKPENPFKKLQEKGISNRSLGGPLGLYYLNNKIGRNALDSQINDLTKKASVEQKDSGLSQRDYALKIMREKLKSD